MPQVITHEKVLLDAVADFAAFVKVIDLLGGKLGPLPLQFPYFNKQKFRGMGFFLERLEPFLERLPKDHQWVVEVRNRIGFRRNSIQFSERKAWHSPW